MRLPSAIVTSVPDPNVFKSGRDFSAWLGSTPRPKSSGGKEKLGSITKQGNAYIRQLLVLGATSLLNQVGKRKGALHDWVVALLARDRLGSSRWRSPTSLPKSRGRSSTGKSFRIEAFAKA